MKIKPDVGYVLAWFAWIFWLLASIGLCAVACHGPTLMQERTGSMLTENGPSRRQSGISVNTSTPHTSVVVNESPNDSYRVPTVASSYTDDENPFDDNGGAVMDGKSVFGNYN